MEILVLGWYNHHNIGDESYKDTFRNVFPQHSFTFVDHIHKEYVDKCEAVILGGGNVIRGGFLDELRKVKNKKIYAISSSLEENVDLSLFTKIYARDSKTFEAAQAQGIPCQFMPDLALTMQGDANQGREWLKANFKKEGCDLYSKVVTVIVNAYMMNGHIGGLARDALSFMKFSYDFARVLDETPASFVFLPFGTQVPFDDRISNSWIAAKCKYWKKNFVIYDRLSPQVALDIIAASDATISSRLHSSIFSFVSGVPFVDITHHSKNALFLEMIGQSKNSVNFWHFDPEALKSKLTLAMDAPHHCLSTEFANQIRETANGIHFS